MSLCFYLCSTALFWVTRDTGHVVHTDVLGGLQEIYQQYVNVKKKTQIPGVGVESKMHLMVTMAVMVLSKGLSLARVSTGRLSRKPQLSRRRTWGGDVCLVVGDVNGGEVSQVPQLT